MTALAGPPKAKHVTGRIGAAKAVCLEMAEDEAERSRSVGATAAQQTAFIIAARIRKWHVEVR